MFRETEKRGSVGKQKGFIPGGSELWRMDHELRTCVRGYKKNNNMQQGPQSQQSLRSSLSSPL